MMCSNKCILPFFGRCQEASTGEEHVERAEGNLTWKKKENILSHIMELRDPGRKHISNYFSLAHLIAQ